MLEWLHQMILYHPLLLGWLIAGWVLFAVGFLAGAIWLEIIVHEHFADLFFLSPKRRKRHHARLFVRNIKDIFVAYYQGIFQKKT